MRSLTILTVAAIGMLFIQGTAPEPPKAEGGITFFEGSWEEALQKAEKEGKLVFMDAYAVWCGPCKLLKRNVFSNPEVGAYFNEHFINVAMDMERGEGRELARQYRVTAYPTLFFVEPDGNVRRKAVGYRHADQLLALAKGLETSKS